MSKEPSQIPQELLCINAEKVYDWVILQATIDNNVLAADLGPLPIDPCAPTVSNLTTNCFLADVNGNPIPLNSEIPVTEVGERQDRDFIIDGAQVSLQNVSYQETIYLVVEFSGLNATTPFIEQSPPIPIELPDSVFLCAPEGTSLVVRLTDLDCNVGVNCTGGALTSVDIRVNLCQSVQAVTNVTVELVADFCEPRDIITEQCTTPLIPPQCPILFPG